MTISEALSWLKTLKTRHDELVQLRNQNSAVSRARYPGQPDITTEPQYDARKLDKRVTLLARELRLCDEAVKRANAATILPGYERNDDVLGELEE